MVLDLSTAITELHNEKGIDEDLIIKTVEQALTKAYEKYYGTIENLVIKNDNYVLSVYSKKDVIEEVDDDLFEISLEDAQKINSEAEIGDSMLIQCDVDEFGLIAIHAAKQIILQKLKEIEKNSTLSEYKSKEGEIIIGYIQRIKNDNVFVDIGNMEGILPKRNQSPLEHYQVNDRIKTLVKKVEESRDRKNVSVILSRTDVDFIKKLIEVEIPEIYDKTVEVKKIVREPGYRTKIAVYCSKDDIDPVGACVGQKGSRIQNIITELEGEKIDILKWTIDSKMFIKNALIPAQVSDVIITDEPNKKAVAVVDESQLSFAIGKKGLNIKLANQLTDWNIDVLKVEDALEQGLIKDHVKDAENLFRTDNNEINELELPTNIKDLLFNNNIYTIEQLVDLVTIDDILKLEGFEADSASYLKNFIDETFEVIEDDDPEEVIIEANAEEQDGVVYYQCPECGANITEDQTSCPNCGIEISFEDDEAEGDEEDPEETDK